MIRDPENGHFSEICIFSYSRDRRDLYPQPENRVFLLGTRCAGGFRHLNVYSSGNRPYFQCFESPGWGFWTHNPWNLIESDLYLIITNYIFVLFSIQGDDIIKPSHRNVWGVTLHRTHNENSTVPTSNPRYWWIRFFMSDLTTPKIGHGDPHYVISEQFLL